MLTLEDAARRQQNWAFFGAAALLGGLNGGRCGPSLCTSSGVRPGYSPSFAPLDGSASRGRARRSSRRAAARCLRNYLRQLRLVDAALPTGDERGVWPCLSARSTFAPTAPRRAMIAIAAGWSPQHVSKNAPSSLSRAGPDIRNWPGGRASESSRRGESPFSKAKPDTRMGLREKPRLDALAPVDVAAEGDASRPRRRPRTRTCPNGRAPPARATAAAAALTHWERARPSARTRRPRTSPTRAARTRRKTAVTDASYATSGPPAAATASSTSVTRQVPTKSGGCRFCRCPRARAPPQPRASGEPSPQLHLPLRKVDVDPREEWIGVARDRRRVVLLGFFLKVGDLALAAAAGDRAAPRQLPQKRCKPRRRRHLELPPALEPHLPRRTSLKHCPRLPLFEGRTSAFRRREGLQLSRYASQASGTYPSKPDSSAWSATRPTLTSSTDDRSP